MEDELRLPASCPQPGLPPASHRSIEHTGLHAPSTRTPADPHPTFRQGGSGAHAGSEATDGARNNPRKITASDRLSHTGRHAWFTTAFFGTGGDCIPHHL